jgi:hypothetical protein
VFQHTNMLFSKKQQKQLPKSNYAITKNVKDTVYSEASNINTEEEAAAMYASMLNRSHRLKDQTGNDYTFDQVVNIPSQYLGKTNPQYEAAKNESLDFLSKEKYKKIENAVKQIDEVRSKIGDFDSFSQGLPEGVTNSVKIGKHYFYKMPTNLRPR